ncbi:MAG: hypothetical protein IJT94_15250 [Oscillibacter sp.]|nr:hypothetical protein [Oscillibacter sp.]
MTAVSRQVAQMVNILPEEDQTLALEIVKKLVLAWDLDYVKCTPEEEAAIDQAAREMENGEYVLHDEINWD